jgi:hemerythrin-like domain-containing protein
MESALATLRHEHQRMLAAAAATEAVAAAITAGADTAPQTLEAAAEFFALFAHRIHRDKEEELLFPALRDRGVRDASCIAPLLADHEDALAAFTTMQHAAAEYSAGDREAATRWAQAARRYCDRLRYHVRREELVIANSERLFSATDQQELARQFAALDEKARRSGVAERIEAAERSLAAAQGM